MCVYIARFGLWGAEGGRAGREEGGGRGVRMHVLVVGLRAYMHMRVCERVCACFCACGWVCTRVR